VSRAKKRGYRGDGGGLYLQISSNGAKSWVFRFRDGQKLREMGLGPCHTVSLADARHLARECRKQRLAGTDPIQARHAARAAARLEAAKAMTFKQCAEAYIAAHKAGWKNAKHAGQWSATLATYAYPIIGELPVQAIDTGLVMRVLEPIWTTKTETASRLRGRIESVLDWARVRGYRDGENPARWRGHLDHLLPERGKVAKVDHHAALPYREMANFMTQLRQQSGVSPLALEFAILTAARTGEVIGANWGEIDLNEGLWTIPAARMKAAKEHRVPLSQPATVLIHKLSEMRTSAFVFPGGRAGKPLSNMALLTTLRRMGRGDLTAHGFRSTFRDWAAERTTFPAEVAEQALAHSLPSKVEAAYRRGDLFEKRRHLMDAWGNYCETKETLTTAKVVPIKATQRSAPAHELRQINSSRGQDSI
jgi:integrase